MVTVDMTDQQMWGLLGLVLVLVVLMLWARH
jgi:hypothetical protein